MKASGDVVILGGGIIGLTTAYYLANAGAHVVVAEAGQLGREASWAGAGIIPPSDPMHAHHPFDRLRALSGGLYPSLSAELLERTAIDNGYRRCGALEWCDENDVAADHEWCGHGVETRTVDPGAFEPAVAGSAGTARLIADMAQVRNPRHLQALKAACQATGRVRLEESLGPLRLVVDAGQVRAVASTKNAELTGDQYLLAAGAWTDEVFRPHGIRLGVVPVRGQIALLNPGRRLFRHVLVQGSRYLVPREDGLILVGSTEEHVGFDKRNTAQAIRDLLDLAVQLVPALAEATVERCWSGLRPASPDGLPYLGRVPGIDNLFVAAGHFRSGIQLAPGSAWLMKELMLGEPPSLPMEAFGVERALVSGEVVQDLRLRGNT